MSSSTSSSWYRNSVWQLKGNKEFTRAGYENASSRFVETDLDVDCSSRHYMITGANSGIGLATALEIARRGGILHLVCRNATAMKDARSSIITTTGNDRIYQHQVNLSNPKEVARWAENFVNSYDRLDVLINNAGCLLKERTVGEEGLETTFAVNTLAVHIITSVMIPLLERSDDARVIIVSSGGMLKVKLSHEDLNFEKMEPFDGRLAYSQTKRQQVVMNFCYAQRHEKIKFYSMHPGWADTPSVRNSLPEFYESMKNVLRTPLQGADTIIWLAVSKAALDLSSGLFFQDRTPVNTHLPLAWTRNSIADEQIFMQKLEEIAATYLTIPSQLADTNPSAKTPVVVDFGRFVESNLTNERTLQLHTNGNNFDEEQTIKKDENSNGLFAREEVPEEIFAKYVPKKLTVISKNETKDGDALNSLVPRENDLHEKSQSKLDNNDVNNIILNSNTSTEVYAADVIHTVDNVEDIIPKLNETGISEFADDNHVSPVNGDNDNHVLPVNGSNDNYVLPVNGGNDNHVLSVNGSNDNHVLSVKGSNDNDVLSVNGSNENHVLPVNGSNDNHVLPVNGSNDNHVLSSNGSNDNPVLSVNGSNDNHVLSVNGSNDNHVLSLNGSNDNHVLPVNGSNDNHVLPVDGSTDNQMTTQENS